MEEKTGDSLCHFPQNEVVAERSSALDSGVLVLLECGFESRPGRSRHLSKTLNQIALSFGWDIML